MHPHQSAQTSASIAAYSSLQSTGFASFWKEWADYVLSLNEMDEETAEAAYLEALAKVQQMVGKPLWRGMSVAAAWTDDWTTKPVGTFWSQDARIAESFQQAVSVYDERFLELESSPRPKKVMLHAHVPYESIDVRATIAAQLACAEDEVRLVEGGQVQLLALSVDGIAVPVCGRVVIA